MFVEGVSGAPTVAFEIVGSHGRSRSYTACPSFYQDVRLFQTKRPDNLLIDTDGMQNTLHIIMLVFFDDLRYHICVPGQLHAEKRTPYFFPFSSPRGSREMSRHFDFTGRDDSYVYL